MAQQDSITRRKFIKAVGVGAAALTLPGCATTRLRPFSIRQGGTISPNEKLNVASIGAGGQGWHDVHGMESENIVALCDVDENRAMKCFADFPNARRFKDYRVMLEKMDKEIDAVTVSTPDHTHYPAAKAAIEMGKHVFVQKPLTHTIWEARDLARLAREHGVVTQMGNQGHGYEGTRLVKEWIDSGRVGEVKQVDFWTDRPIRYWKQGLDRPTEVQPVPVYLDWNLWLGTAPYRPYNEAYAPFRWRAWWDFGCGSLGDMACHVMDAAFWALDLKHPEWVEAETSPVNEETGPNWSIVRYKFPARGNKPPCLVTWYDGGKMPPRPEMLEPDRQIPTDGGTYFHGTKETIMSGTYCRSPRIIPEERMKAFDRPEKTIPRSPGHYQEWINACKGEGMTMSNFDYAGPFTEMVLLGNLAIRTGERVEWDSENLRCTNVPAANQYVRNEFRRF
jgi:predicted dehydrogenase